MSPSVSILLEVDKLERYGSRDGETKIDFRKMKGVNISDKLDIRYEG